MTWRVIQLNLRHSGMIPYQIYLLNPLITQLLFNLLVQNCDSTTASSKYIRRAYRAL